MANIVTSYNNFSKAKIDHDMMGRFDLPIYNSGADAFKNFISNFKGGAIFRTGTESIYTFQDCAFVEFKYSATQNYIIVMYNTKMRFLSYASNGDFGWVESAPNVPLEVTTPYTLAHSKEIALNKPTQNYDVMIFTHGSYAPYKLTRVSATSFTFTQFARKDDPFGLTYDATKTITGITQAANGVVTAVGHGYSVGDMVKILAVVGMTQINSYTARVVTTPTADTFSIDVATTSFTAYSSGGTAAKLLTADYPACGLYYRGRLYYARTTSKPTTVWGSESANYDIFTLPASIVDSSAMQFTIADISQKIEWLFGGDNSLIAGAQDGIVAINGGGVNVAIKADTVEAKLTSAEGCNSAYPVRKDGLIFYVGRNNRNVYYFSYDLLTESFIAKDANFISYDITQGGITKLRYKKDRNDLLYHLRNGALVTLNFNQAENITGWHEHDTEGTFTEMASITDNDGNPQMFYLALRNSVYYIERQTPYVEFKPLSDFIATNKAADKEAYYRYVAEQLKSCIYLDNALTYSDLRTATITYDSGAGTITAGSSSFVVGDVGKHIVYKTATGYESGRFEIIGYTSATVVTVEVLQTPTANSYASWYLTFSSLSGLSQYNGYEVGVVVDGGYLDDYTISGGTQDFDEQYTSAVIGYKYKGLIKSFCLGFQVQGKNTQGTMKSIYRVGIRTIASAGGKIGTDPYRLASVQEITQGDLNYLPPLPMDGTKYVSYSDDSEIEKFFYIVQDEPLPFHAAVAMVEANYTVSS